ncbi:MAG: hypothetical protein L0227_13985, partial [Chloroflexi bacterium]|nr:hypothetical protein [Chloroflexota bacterium]
RPYKGALGHDDAVAELTRNRGTQFDPELVDIFISLFGSRREAVDAPAPGTSKADGRPDASQSRRSKRVVGPRARH